mmetsp:Transcript_7750/g.16481  ORF Transcript_7750/g.16481 Transcript_7750/m.16481 type:complete len:212 (+) Transcript_7750:968-1603(+)
MITDHPVATEISQGGRATAEGREDNFQECSSPCQHGRESAWVHISWIVSEEDLGQEFSGKEVGNCRILRDERQHVLEPRTHFGDARPGPECQLHTLHATAPIREEEAQQHVDVVFPPTRKVDGKVEDATEQNREVDGQQLRESQLRRPQRPQKQSDVDREAEHGQPGALPGHSLAEVQKLRQLWEERRAERTRHQEVDAGTTQVPLETEAQ